MCHSLLVTDHIWCWSRDLATEDIRRRWILNVNHWLFVREWMECWRNKVWTCLVRHMISTLFSDFFNLENRKYRYYFVARSSLSFTCFICIFLYLSGKPTLECSHFNTYRSVIKCKYHHNYHTSCKTILICQPYLLSLSLSYVANRGNIMVSHNSDVRWASGCFE